MPNGRQCSAKYQVCVFGLTELRTEPMTFCIPTPLSCICMVVGSAGTRQYRGMSGIVTDPYISTSLKPTWYIPRMQQQVPCSNLVCWLVFISWLFSYIPPSHRKETTPNAGVTLSQRWLPLDTQIYFPISIGFIWIPNDQPWCITTVILF